jgi:rRNA pseudouridine-1189 N-methylase Emg1 (Nep1/Mra1 family)
MLSEVDLYSWWILATRNILIRVSHQKHIPKSPERFHCHFCSLYENLNFWSKLALIIITGKIVYQHEIASTYGKNEKKNQCQLRPEIQIFI